MNAPDRIAEVKDHSLTGMALALGFEVTTGTGGAASTRCPACGAPTRHPNRKDRRGAVGIRKDGRGWRCFECDASGTALDFAAHALLGRPANRQTLGSLLDQCAGLGLCSHRAGTAPSVPVVRRIPAPAARMAPEHVRPPPSELAALLAASLPLDAATPRGWPAGWCDDVREYLRGRGIDSALCLKAGLDACILPPPGKTEACAWWPYSAHTYRLAMPAVDVSGQVVSLHARAIRSTEGKTRWPRGVSSGGLFFADDAGRQFLRQRMVPGGCGGLDAVIFTEGMTDALTVATVAYRAALDGKTWGVLGLTSGSERAFAGHKNFSVTLKVWQSTWLPQSYIRFKNLLRFS